MFDGLDKIDWANFGKHIAVSCDSADIPKFIRQLLANDEKERIEALGFLLGEGQHIGMLASATPYLIPFVLEVLSNNTYPERDYILNGLEYMSVHILHAKTIMGMRFAIKVYDSLEKGLPVYLKLLDDSDEEIRIASIQLLRYMQESAIPVLDSLMKRFGEETVLQVRLAIIENMALLMKEAWLLYNPDTQIYREFIASIVDKGADYTERELAVSALKTLDYRR
jgi:hypothetical protein